MKTIPQAFSNFKAYIKVMSFVMEIFVTFSICYLLPSDGYFLVHLTNSYLCSVSAGIAQDSMLSLIYIF